jgi:hypothetical protein
MQVFGVMSKSAFFILEGAMVIQAAVVTDCHVKKCAIAYGFVHKGSSEGEEIYAMLWTLTLR